MHRDIEVPDLMSIITVRRFQLIKRKPLAVRELRAIATTPFAPEAASFVLDRDEARPPAYFRIIGRSRFTPRQQMNIDRAERAVGSSKSRGMKVTVSTFPADRAGVVNPRRTGSGAARR